MPDFELRASEQKLTSQNGEDGVLNTIFANIGVTNRYFVEFGCEDATECNSAHLLDLGWQGLFMDGAGVSRNPKAVVRKEVVTAENINSLFQKYSVPESFDLLSIDIDGNDYWVWQAIAYRPRVVVIEYNSHVPASEDRVIAYDPWFRWNGSDYYGASLLALRRLGERKGYTLVYCESTGTNAFFVAKHALPRGFDPLSVERLHRSPNFLGRGLQHPPDKKRQMKAPAHF